MSHQIIKQPNGLLCIFSSISDEFVLFNATTSEVINFLLIPEQQRVEDEVKRVFRKIQNQEKPYAQFTLSFEEAFEQMQAAYPNRRFNKSLF